MDLPPDLPAIDAPDQHGLGFRPGDLLADRYRIEEFLGRGGMGEVYRAQDLELGVTVALKTIRPEITANPSALRGLKQEVLTARSVAHPCVCRIYDFGRHRDRGRDVSFLTMEFLSGETLSARLLARRRLNREEALAILRQVAEGLDAAHRVGIVHRDFKSANVILVPDRREERVVITDFGLAIEVECLGPAASGPAMGEATARDRLEEPHAASTDDEATVVHVFDPEERRFVGTPAYMAPEQVRGESVGPAADLYALGVTLFELRTGELPFRERTAYETARARLRKPPPRPSSLVELEPEWEEAILQLLSVDPTDRFKSAHEVVRVLDQRRVFPAERPSYSLPAEHDAFVGRKAALSELAGCLEPAASLVTLLGVGGTGKTRLARRYGWESLERWPGGVWFCDLTEARDIAGVASGVATALRVPLGKDDPVVQLGRAIARRGRALVVLDNFEQVAGQAAATLGRWRVEAPEASFLVTTRERLQLDGETVLVVEPLEPASEGAELLEERARFQLPGFSITPGNRAAVVEIVRLLDGLPLAIELATSRLRLLSLEQLRERLANRFAVLGGTKPGRHGTLRATLDWSWSLLTPWEQSAISQASVFQGGFTLEAAEGVIDVSAYPDAPLVLDVLQSLVDKSWLWARVVLQAPRFGMYVTVQEYAAEKLASPSEAEARHGRYFATLGTEEAIEALDQHGGTARRAALSPELDNLIAACRASMVRGTEDVSAATYLAASAVLAFQGPLALSADLGLQVLAQMQDPARRARVLSALGSAERAGGLHRDAQVHSLAALEIHRELGDRRGEGIVLGNLGGLLYLFGQAEEARTHYEAALAIHREVRNRLGEGQALGNLGLLECDRSRMTEARQYLEAALSVHREVGQRRAEGAVLNGLATVHLYEGRRDEARRYFEAALEIHRELGDRRSKGIVHGNLGELHREQGRMDEARSHFEAALATHREVGNRRFEGIAIADLAALDREQGRMEEARSRFEAALAIHHDVGNHRFEGIAIADLAALDRDQGRVEEARSRYEAALAIHHEAGDRRNEAVVLGCLGGLLRDLGRWQEARSRYEEALAIHRELGDGPHQGAVLGDLAQLCAEQGEAEEARRLLEESAGVLREKGDRRELGKIFCQRATLEHRLGNTAAARSSLAEAEQHARIVGAGPESPLGQALAKLRATLSEEPGG